MNHVRSHVPGTSTQVHAGTVFPEIFGADKFAQDLKFFSSRSSGSLASGCVSTTFKQQKK